jgi:hypothetical protein
MSDDGSDYYVNQNQLLPGHDDPLRLIFPKDHNHSTDAAD